MEPTVPTVVVHGADCRRSRQRWRSSSNAAAVDVGSGYGGLRPRWSLSTEAAVGWSRRAPIIVVDSDGKDTIAATAIDRRHSRR